MNTLTKPITALMAGWLFACAPAASGNDRIELTILISGATPGTGQAVIAVFSSPATFLKKPVITQTLPIDKNGGASFELSSLKSGVYAISAYYDQDSNGKLNTGLFGIPTELVGFSNGAKGLFGPPAFKDAAITLTTAQSIKIQFGKAKD